MRASAILSSSFDYRATVGQVVHEVVHVLADVCAVDLLDGEGNLRRLEIAAAEPASTARLAAFRKASPTANEASALGSVIVSKKPLLVAEYDASPSDGFDKDALAAIAGARSLMLVPLLVRDTALGAITFIAAAPGRRFGDRSLSTAIDLAAHIAIAIDNGRLYERAQQAIRARDEILSFVSHDLRNPLMGILLTVDTVLRAAPATERRRGWKQLERIRRGAQQMRHMIDDLLDVASMDAGRLTIDTAAHDVAPLFSDTHVLLAPLAAEKSIALRFETPAGALAVACDRNRVIQVLSNLIGNAIKFTPVGGLIAVAARPAANQVLFTVGDTGPGIAPNQRSHLFERFWRAEDASRKGQGLGLYIAKRLVEAQGGVIWLDSQDPRGTTFSFTLPLAAAGAAASPPATDVAAANDVST